MTTVRPENNAIKGRTKHFLTYHLFQKLCQLITPLVL